MDSSFFFSVLRRNIITPVVIATYTLAIILLIIGEIRDAVFISSVITFNTLFAIFQEIRAHRMLKKLELMNAPTARIPLPDGTYRNISYEEVEVGMTLGLIAGDDIPADGEIIESHGFEVNESILTGESRPIEKPVGSKVLSSSAVSAGSALMRVTAVGEQTHAGQMTAKLKAYHPQLTPLQQLINKLIFYLTFFALGLIVLIAVVYWYDGHDTRVIFKTITSAGIAVIPEGLLLSSTVLLAFGSIKLSQAKVLPQKISAIEGMALLRILCTDKTGTLTDEAIRFEKLEVLDSSWQEKDLKHAIGTAFELIGDDNSTSRAILQTFSPFKDATAQEIVAFSSDRKYSAARFSHQKHTYSLIIGAPEFVSIYAPLNRSQQNIIKEYASKGMRVLLVGEVINAATKLKDIKKSSAQPIGLILLSNALRSGVVDSITYLQNQGVELKVISGDNPQTVQAVAVSAGIRGTEHCITGAELATLTDAKWDEAVQNTTIFARILPEQKERIITALQKNGAYTGMVGDGVNDALALKKSDLGIAMYAGASASRRVADIVLLNNSFNALPLGMRLGNRIMQAIEIISVLSFYKITFGVTILFITLLFGLQYPFAPRHNTFMNIFIMTLPTLMWTFFLPEPQHRVDPRHYWRDTLKAILPVALISGAAVAFCYIYMAEQLEYGYTEAGTITVLLTTVASASLVLLSGRIMNVHETKKNLIARILYACVAIALALVVFGIGPIRHFFDFQAPDVASLAQLWPIAAAIVGMIILQLLFVEKARRAIIRNYSHRKHSGYPR